ncbi:MAG: STT3 domain-containing protein [Nitrosopumilus sp.]|uniref:STT3 domain-containing protein n=1 Tax=Nitrosopumilus sp. TaxID=2024843 RepID=UPI00292F61B2|nr:STT3 domain-containing protein [Nitrosopumilus sp.]
MLTKTKLVTIGSFNLKPNHLLIIGILALSFTVSFLLRSQAADFGFELNEFDPFFNYRATQYAVTNGIDAYFQWNDNLSWYPHGRDVSATSQVMLHLTTSSLYWIFGGGMDLYDFTILFPAVFGSLSAIVLFALVRVLAGTTAGLFSAVLFSISLPILIRGPIGWFKSEPLGLFFSLLTIYLLLSGINSQNKKIAFLKLVGAGIFTSFSISAWGGNQFFIILVGIFFLTLPFLRKDHKFIVWSIPVYTVTTIFVSLGFERVSSNFVFGLGGISLIIPTLFLILCVFIQNKSQKNKTRNGLLLLLSFIIIASSFLIINSDSQFLPLPSYRYLNALNPFLTTTDPLVDSVSEHATTTLSQSFTFHSILMIFAGIGIWLIIKNTKKNHLNFIKNDMLSFSLILGIAGVYVSSTFVRLEVFASIAIIVLASLGLTALTKEFFQTNSTNKQSISKLIKLSFVSGIIILLIVPMVYPGGNGLFTVTKTPPTILNGGSIFNVGTTDWLDSLEWIKNNTPKDAVIAAWWDYGYWISTMGERASLADNSTIHTDIIQNIAKMLLSTPDDAWISLNEMQADYVLVFVAGQKLGIGSEESLYLLQGGGDESKKQWFMRIAEEDLSKYLFYDGISGTSYFWDNTLLGKMFPFTPVAYVDFQTNQQFLSYQPGLEPVYIKNVKYPSDGTGPFRLVYASPSFTEEKVGPMIGVFVYEVNKQYTPNS